MILQDREDKVELNKGESGRAEKGERVFKKKEKKREKKRKSWMIRRRTVDTPGSHSNQFILRTAYNTCRTAGSWLVHTGTSNQFIRTGQKGTGDFPRKDEYDSWPSVGLLRKQRAIHLEGHTLYEKSKDNLQQKR